MILENHQPIRKAVLIFLSASSLLAANAVAVVCPAGCEEHQGVCACDAPPEKAQVVTDASVISDEKPPQDKMPSYQREGIHADMPVSTAGHDAMMDAERDNANSEGKKAAGL